MSGKIEISRELLERRTIEFAIERFEICQDQAFQSCECEECQQCGKMPDECTGTDCAQTCQCSTCEHCMNELAMKELRAILAAPYHVVCSNGILCQDRSCAECGGNGATDISVAAPAVERQPVAYVLTRDDDVCYEADDGIVISNTPGDETSLYKWKPVYFDTSQPATVSNEQPVAYMRNEVTPNNLVLCSFNDPGAFGVYRGPKSVPVAVVLDERAAFEKTVIDMADRFHPDLSKYGIDGEYKHAQLQYAWELWQARACIDKGKEMNQSAAPGFTTVDVATADADGFSSGRKSLGLLLAPAFRTIEQKGGKYSVKLAFEDSADAWAAYEEIEKASALAVKE